MKKLLVTLLIALPLLSGCTKDEAKPNPIEFVFCPVADAVMFQLAHGIAAGLECRAPEMIMYDLKKVTIEKMGMCRDSNKAAMGIVSAACKSVGKSLIQYAASGAIPKAWECSPNAAKEKLESLINSQCDKIKI